MPLPGGAITLLQKKGSCKNPKKRDGSASPSRTAGGGSQGPATSPRRRHSQNQPPLQASLAPGSPQLKLSRRPSSPMNLSPSDVQHSPRTTPKSPKAQTKESGKISPQPRN